MTTIHHITDDQELLADFVLGRLPDAARTEWENHIASCEACAGAVRQERAITAGIRRAGRDRLKARLAAAGRSMERQVPWPRILSIAAVLAVAVGLGVYEHWFTPESLPIASLDQKPINAQRDVPYRPPDDQALKQTQERNEVGETRMAERSAPLADRRDIAPAPAAPPAVAAGGANNMKADKDAEVAVSSDIAITGAAASAPAKSAMQLDEKGAIASAWIEGNRIEKKLSTAPGSGALYHANEPSAERAMGKVVADETRKSKEESYAGADALSANTLQFSVRQRPASSLPATQQSARQAALSNTVQTMVVRKGDSLALTLYLDTLLDERTLQRARVNQVGADSVVVEMDGQKIGYGLGQIGAKRTR